MSTEKSLLEVVKMPDRVIAQTLATLTGPTRHYHDITHIIEMWNGYREITRTVQTSALDDQIVGSAILFHDIIYDATARPGQNEYASGEHWARLAAYSPIRDQVRKIILATAHHMDNRPADRLTDWVLDLDLQRMALPEDEFMHYSRLCRAEFSHLSDTEWNLGNSKFLRTILTKPKIFYSETFVAQNLDAKVRANIETLLRLRGC